jgi:hypothetical protein
MSRPPCFFADKPPGEAQGGVLTSEARKGERADKARSAVLKATA